MHKIIVLPEAEEDLKESIDHYLGINKRLADTFIKLIDQTFLFIAEKPYASPIVSIKIRKLPVTDFPFNIYYFIKNDSIYILAVFHTKRNPKTWKKRTE